MPVLNQHGADAPVIVLGMHRSGTSVVVRALNLGGLWLGEEEHLISVTGRAYEGNRKGNYERSEVRLLNDAILARSRGSWRKPPYELQVEAKHYERALEILAAIRQEQPVTHPRWGWKDPRTLLTLDFWLEVLGGDAALVGIFRHPQLVARSLQARNGMPLEQGYALWAHYNHRLLRYLHRHGGALLQFDVAPTQLRADLERVCDGLGLSCAGERFDAWYDISLVHQAMPDDAPALFDRVRPLWHLLLHYAEQAA